MAINDLLKLLRGKNIPNLPLDARTLLSSNTSKVEVIEVPPGQYWHYGAGKSLSSILENSEILPECVSLTIGIDGIPISKCSKSQFWPILARIEHSNTFVIGLYCGTSKPESPEKFLRPFVDEMKKLIANGINIKNKHIQIKVLCFICDAPAKAFITCTKSHNAYFGCGKCTLCRRQLLSY